MSTEQDQLRQSVVGTLDSLAGSGAAVTRELIAEWVHRFAPVMPAPVSPEAAEALIRELEATYNIYVGNWASLENNENHVPWLDHRRDGIDWKFWDRYKRYLKADEKLPPASIRSLHEVTDDILSRLEAPDRPGEWDRRGLVAGQVQSGKTGNYIGLIAKALDSGYKLIVVLAGVHNSLRSQTQSRVDTGILGFDTRNALRSDQAAQDIRIGVGRYGSFLPVNSFTSSKDNGDFSLTVARSIGVQVGGPVPTLLVVKKNARILTTLHQWATRVGQVDEETGKVVVRSVPLLVIDDEADHASVDTNGPKRNQADDEVDPTRINGLIRDFLNTFEQSAYVGYTATPFANIFIDPDRVHHQVGKDLFPENFILNLPAPSSYVGPARVFGLEPDAANGTEPVEALPIVRYVPDYSDWLPDGHKADYRITSDLPDSLRKAILSFVMSVAVRDLRGQTGKHNSMLVHVTRFTAVQRQVWEQVTGELESIANRLRLGEGRNPLLRPTAQDLYSSDYIATNRQVLESSDVAEQAGELPPFELLWEQMAAVAERTVVHRINGTSDDALEYVDHPNGLNVIAIGGDKLSRGLTLEGLSVSYYLRASRMYDTLMQMGRWFGYRAGYLDLCRLYTTPTLTEWYSSITAAAEELTAEFEAMAAIGRTPEDFGLRVRSHPGGLLVTSPTKLRHATKVKLSYAGTITETVTFSKTAARVNWAALDTLVTSLGADAERASGQRVWRGIGPDQVLKFLEAYRADPAAVRAQPGALADYIRSRVADGELTSWTVALGDPRSGSPRRQLGGLDVGLTKRQPLDNITAARATVKRIGDPRHEVVTLQPEGPEWNSLLHETVKAWSASTRRKKSATAPQVPGGYFERQSRQATRGLLLLYALDPEKFITALPGELLDGSIPLVGFAVSFPASDKAVPVEYQVNKAFWVQEYASYITNEDE